MALMVVHLNALQLYLLCTEAGCLLLEEDEEEKGEGITTEEWNGSFA